MARSYQRTIHSSERTARPTTQHYTVKTSSLHQYILTHQKHSSVHPDSTKVHGPKLIWAMNAYSQHKSVTGHAHDA
jgi:hypothetical protein